MNIQNIIKTLFVAGTIGIMGCGGGGGSSPPPPSTPATPAKTATTISGTVSFPSISSLVSKQVDSAVPDTSVTVQAFTLEGVAVGTPVTPTYDDTVAGSSTDFTKRVYTYMIPDIPIGKDYIVKAKHVEAGKTQELKKLIEKTDVVEAPLINQNLHSVSTAAVVVASQKLTASLGIADKISLGDALPSLGTKTVTNLSDAIVTDVAPKSLETSIQAAKDTVSAALLTPGGLDAALASMTSEDKKALADLVNMLNIVVASVANNADPSQILAGSSTVQLSTSATAPQLKLLSVDSTSGTIAQATTATTSITQTIIQDTVTSAVVTYVPPRVKVELSTDATALYGIVIELAIPADAKVRTDSAGKLDMALLNVPAGVTFDAQYFSATRKIRIAMASGSAPLQAKFITLSFDRTLGVKLTNIDFTSKILETSDSLGSALSANVLMTVISSGS